MKHKAMHGLIFVHNDRAGQCQPVDAIEPLEREIAFAYLRMASTKT